MTRMGFVGVVLACATAIGCTALVVAGPLDPPAGAVGSTYKTLAEVEPRIAINATNTPGDADSLFKITQPGSYYLDRNVTGGPAKYGIEITVGGVTIDLNGFELVGAAGGNFPGIATTVGLLSNITVRNGTVRGWGGDGIDFENFDAFACRIERISAGGNGGVGIAVANGATVVDCVAWGNGSSGIFALGGSVIRGCVVRQNNVGISAFGSGIIECAAADNTLTGIFAGSGATVVGSSAYNNGGGGIGASGARVSGCSAYFNGVGIDADAGSLVEGCEVYRNAGDGILAGADCTIRGNTCSWNGNSGAGAGVHATGDDNRIEGNHCTDADLGIWVQGSTNVLFRNTCAGNTANWLLSANNIFGAIIDRTAVATGSVSGNSAAATTATSDPNANFSH